MAGPSISRGTLSTPYQPRPNPLRPNAETQRKYEATRQEARRQGMPELPPMSDLNADEQAMVADALGQVAEDRSSAWAEKFQKDVMPAYEHMKDKPGWLTPAEAEAARKPLRDLLNDIMSDAGSIEAMTDREREAFYGLRELYKSI